MLFLRRGIATLALSAIGFGAGAAFTSIASAQTLTTPVDVAPHHLRGEKGSRYNIRIVERRIHRLIGQLQHDQRDYGGHRVSAVNFLNQADAELRAAVRYDIAHP